MLTRILPFALLFALVPALAACGVSFAADNKIPADVQAALDKADAFELYSLDPSREPLEPAKEGEAEKDDPTKFQGWKILGNTTIKQQADRGKLVTTLQKSVADNTGIVAACFNPRHGIRVNHDGKVFDIVICFECYSANTYTDNKRGEGFLVTRTPQPMFDEVLTAAKVPLPKAAKE